MTDGIDDVKSGSRITAMDGTKYSRRQLDRIGLGSKRQFSGV